MTTLIKNIYETYNYIEHDLSDPRTRHYDIILNPFFILVLIFTYHRFIYKWGPKFMEKRPPFKLEKTLIIYNAIQIVLSLYLFIRTMQIAWLSGYYSIICQPICWDDTPVEREINKIIRVYYLVKIVDLLDTVFFILRKKYNQASFLHVYHHIGMVCAGFLSLKYVPGGHSGILGTINSLIHAIMYFYYLLSCLSPEYKKSLWWKKHLTQLQIVQFLFLSVHFTHVLFQPNCAYPKWISLIFVPQNTFMLIMFTDFYIKAYGKKKK